MKDETLYNQGPFTRLSHLCLFAERGGESSAFCQNGTRHEGQARPRNCKQHPNMQYLTQPRDKNKPRATPFGAKMTTIGEASEETKGGRLVKKTGNFDHQLIRSSSCIMNDVEDARLSRRTRRADEARERQEWMNEDGDEFISGLHRFICVIIWSYFKQRDLITLKRFYRCTTIIHPVPVKATNREVPALGAEPPCPDLH